MIRMLNFTHGANETFLLTIFVDADVIENLTFM